MRRLFYSFYLKAAEKQLISYLQSWENPHLRINQSVIQDIKNYLNREYDRMILPAFAFEMNLARVKKELKGKTPQLRYKSFFSQKAPVDKFLFSKYPQLKNFLEIFTHSTTKSLKTCLSRLAKDWETITKTFCPSSKPQALLGIKIPPNGDRHHDGHQTLFLEFDRQFKLVYKPTPINTDNLVDLLTTKIGLKTLPVLSQKNYRYRLFLEKKATVVSKDEVKNFYFQAGKMLALAYIFQATDLHMDNLLANQGNLYLLDNETFFHHFSFAGLPQNHNIFFTGLITDPNNPPKTGILSGLQGGAKPRLSLLTPFVKNEDTDKIRVRYKKFSKFVPHNRIYFQGKLAEPQDYLSEITRGFTISYNFFKQHRKFVLPLLTSLRARQIIRPTSLYSFFIQNLFQPRNLNNPHYPQIITRQLEKGLGNIDKRIKKLISYELEEILNLNIPYFSTDISRSALYDAKGNCYQDFFEASGNKKVIRKINSLSDSDLATQIKKITSAFAP